MYNKNREYCGCKTKILGVLLLIFPSIWAVPTTQFLLSKKSHHKEDLGIPKFFDVANGVDLLIEIDDQDDFGGSGVEIVKDEDDEEETGIITLTISHPLLVNGEVTWLFDVSEGTKIMLNKTICFKKSEETFYDDDASDGDDVGEKTEIITPNIIHVSAQSTLGREKYIQLRLVNRTNKCPQGNEPNIFVGVGILLMGLILIGAVLGVLVKNQLTVCADTGNSFSSVICGS